MGQNKQNPRAEQPVGLQRIEAEKPQAEKSAEKCGAITGQEFDRLDGVLHVRPTGWEPYLNRPNRIPDENGAALGYTKLGGTPVALCKVDHRVNQLAPDALMVAAFQFQR